MNNSQTIKDKNTKDCMCFLFPKNNVYINSYQTRTKKKQVGVANFWAYEHLKKFRVIRTCKNQDWENIKFFDFNLYNYFDFDFFLF